MAYKYIKAMICVTIIGCFIYYQVTTKLTASLFTKTTSILPSTSATVIRCVESCPQIPPGLLGKWVPRMEILKWTVLEGKHPELSAGGRWQPKDCHARHKVAIIIPYRKRSEHLHIFMNNMHDFLQRQQLDYGMYVVEQAGTAPFNRARLLNVGYKEAMKDYKWQCIVLHDVDNIPLNDQNLYTCPHLPRHLSVAVDKWHFKLPYKGYFGGVSILTTKHYEQINGMSNLYWGWGGEDDDLSQRCREKFLVPLLRYSPKVGTYTSIRKYHQSALPNKQRLKLLNEWRKRQHTDGLRDLNYTILKKEYKHLYTIMLVDIGRMTRR